MKFMCDIFVFLFFVSGILAKCDSNQCYQEMDATSITVYSVSSGLTSAELSDHSFIHAQLLKELLLEIKFNDQTSRKDFVQFFTETTEPNEKEAALELDRFYHEHNQHSSIWWYTHPGPIHDLLNDALRTQDVLNLLRMGFFIQKLHRQLKHLSQNADEITEVFLVYRGQGLTYDDYDKLKDIGAGGLLSFNTFLSVNTNYEGAVSSARRAVRDGFETAVLFSITIPSSYSVSIPFACIDDLNYFENSTNDYMFSINVVFQIEQLEKLPGKTGILHVKLRPISTHDQYVRYLMQTARQEIPGSTPTFELAKLAILMKNYPIAEIIYNRLLNDTVAMDDSDREFIHWQLVKVRDEMNDFQGALDSCEHVREVATSHRQTNDPLFPSIFIRTAGLLLKLKRFDEALDKLHEALRLHLQVPVPDYQQRAKIYSDIGVALGEQGKHNESLEFHERSLHIYLEHHPDDHMNLASIYHHLATAYKGITNYDMVLSCYEKAMIQHQQADPVDTKKIINDYALIVQTLKELGREDELAVYAEKTVKYFLRGFLGASSNEDTELNQPEDVIEAAE